MAHNREQLLSLAERVEQATGPDRTLDVYIALAVGALEHSQFYEPESLYGAGCHAYDGLAYTASLDAAITLVPQGWRIGTLAEDTNGKQICHLVHRKTGDRLYSYANALPNALTATAFRALAMEASNV